MSELNSTTISSQVKNLMGRSFGRLKVIKFAGRNKHRRATWLCQCECGREKVIGSNHLQMGQTKSCGCRGRQGRRTHGMDGTQVYHCWDAMIQRCTNPKHPAYHNYGGRGIIVCDRWRTFGNFYADMGDPPSSKHSIERTNNDAGYCPENCRWATRKEQTRNSRRNRILKFHGETKCVAEWAEEIGIRPGILVKRLNAGWSAQRALTEPVHPKRRKED